MSDKKTNHKCGGFDVDNLTYLSSNLTSDGLQQQVRGIKKQLRSVMNGVASTSMSERGLDYRVNYGVPITILKQIAGKIPKNHDLAQLLRLENVRELQIIATLIQPIDSLTESQAKDWVMRIQTYEQAEHACLYLFQYCAFAQQLAFSLLCQSSDIPRFTAWHLLARIARNLELDSRQFEFIIQNALVDTNNSQLSLFNSALLALKRVGVLNESHAKTILESVENYPISNPSRKQQIIDDLKFEFNYYGVTSL